MHKLIQILKKKKKKLNLFIKTTPYSFLFLFLFWITTSYTGKNQLILEIHEAQGIFISAPQLIHELYQKKVQ